MLCRVDHQRYVSNFCQVAFIYSVHSWTTNDFKRKQQEIFQAVVVLPTIRTPEARCSLLYMAFFCVLGACSLALGSIFWLEEMNCPMACHRGAANRSLGPSSCFSLWWPTASWELPLGMPKPNIDPWKHGVGAVGGAGRCQKPFQRYDLPRLRFRQFLQCRGTMPEQIITLGIPKESI